MDSGRFPLLRKAKEEQGSQATFVLAVNQQPHCRQDLGVIARDARTRRAVRDVRGR
jgi:hypothetical protein